MARNGNTGWLLMWIRHCIEFGQRLMLLFSWLWSTCKRRTVRKDDHYGDGSCEVLASQCQHDINDLERREHSTAFSLSGRAEHVLLFGTGTPSNGGACVVSIPESIYSYPQQEQPAAVLKSATEVAVLLSGEMKSCVLSGNVSRASACSDDAATAVAAAPAASSDRNAASCAEACTPVGESIQPNLTMRKVKSKVSTDFTTQLAHIHGASPDPPLESQCVLPVVAAVSEPDHESLAAAPSVVGSLEHMSLRAMVSFGVQEKNRNTSLLGMRSMHAFSSDDCQLGVSMSGPPAVRWPPTRLPEPPPMFEPHSLQPHDSRLPPASQENGGPSEILDGQRPCELRDA